MDKKKDEAKVLKNKAAKKNFRPVVVPPHMVERLPAEQKASERTRTVVADGCPPTMTKDQLKAKFPNAEEVRILALHGKCIGRALVIFSTVKEAETIAQQKTTNIGDRKLLLSYTGHVETPEERERRVREERLRRIKLEGLPTDVKEAEIEAELRKIFPRAEEIRLLFGNQGKFRHRAQVSFSTAAEAQQLAGQSLDVLGTKAKISTLPEPGAGAPKPVKQIKNPLKATPIPQPSAGVAKPSKKNSNAEKSTPHQPSSADSKSPKQPITAKHKKPSA